MSSQKIDATRENIYHTTEARRSNFGLAEDNGAYLVADESSQRQSSLAIRQRLGGAKAAQEGHGGLFFRYANHFIDKADREREGFSENQNTNEGENAPRRLSK
jgi:hypothetical protein